MAPQGRQGGRLRRPPPHVLVRGFSRQGAPGSRTFWSSCSFRRGPRLTSMQYLILGGRTPGFDGQRRPNECGQLPKSANAGQQRRRAHEQGANDMIYSNGFAPTHWEAVEKTDAHRTMLRSRQTWRPTTCIRFHHMLLDAARVSPAAIAPESARQPDIDVRWASERGFR